MFALRFDRIVDFLTGIELVIGLLWLGLAVLSVTLVVLMRTRWGQSRPLRKCLMLSVLAHLLLVGYATTVQIVCGVGNTEEPVLYVSFVDGPARKAAGSEDPVSQEKPWKDLLHEAMAQPDRADPDREQSDEPPEPKRRTASKAVPIPIDPSLKHLVPPDTEPPEPTPDSPTGSIGRTTPGKAPEEITAPTAQRREPPGLNVPERETPKLHPVAGEDRPAPTRTASEGISTSLLEQPVPAPQLETPPTTPDPAGVLAGLTDRLTRPARSEPAESVARDLHIDQRPAGEPTIVPVGERYAGRDASLLPDDAALVASPQLVDVRHSGLQRLLPNIYRLRVSPDRSRLAQRQGATPATEAAVKSALKWLAENQHTDGRWDADDHGAGREMHIDGKNRQRAGIEADTATTGLALLAFLASGHTHLDGHYRENVRRGLEYLLRCQAQDGNLGGKATAYAKMYCHSMAAFAISEAYGMTDDARLRQPVRRAIGYTLAAQSNSDGGWRYRPGDPGDTSQAGWQLMALKSAELAGIPIPVQTRNGLIRFLRSVSSGEHGGLASYRPNQPATRPMTAEALACWQFLGMPREHPAGNEAGDYLLGELPGDASPNLYYWYYATLAMYQLQGIHWERWNDALQATLIDGQRRDGPLAGSWDPDTVWGGYGGRVYSTALGTLCLEVYYRFLPLYIEAAPAEDRAK